MSATAGGGLGFATNDRVPSVDVEPCTALSVSLKLARQRRRLTVGIAAREESVHRGKKTPPGGPAGPPPAGLHLVGVVRDTLSVVLPAACLRDRSGVCSADLRGGERSNGNTLGTQGSAQWAHPWPENGVNCSAYLRCVRSTSSNCTQHPLGPSVLPLRHALPYYDFTRLLSSLFDLTQILCPPMDNRAPTG